MKFVLKCFLPVIFLSVSLVSSADASEGEKTPPRKESVPRQMVKAVLSKVYNTKSGGEKLRAGAAERSRTVSGPQAAKAAAQEGMEENKRRRELQDMRKDCRNAYMMAMNKIPPEWVPPLLQQGAVKMDTEAESKVEPETYLVNLREWLDKVSNYPDADKTKLHGVTGVINTAIKACGGVAPAPK
jgi:hypothetical protein